MLRLLISPRAILDLIEIWNYVADDSEEHADISIDKLNEAIEKLPRNPGMSRQRDELPRRCEVSRFSAMLFFIVAIQVPSRLSAFSTAHATWRAVLSDAVRTVTRSSEIDPLPRLTS
jgi:plasmid stabilization system protein ParE